MMSRFADVDTEAGVAHLDSRCLRQEFLDRPLFLSQPTGYRWGRLNRIMLPTPVADETPNFIDLDILGFYITDAIHKLFAVLSGNENQVG